MSAAEKTRLYPPVERPKPFRQDSEFLRLKRRAIEAERTRGDGEEVGGTGQTILKLQGSPVAKLLDLGKIHLAELRAVEDIETAHHALSSGLWIRPQSLEKIDRAHGGAEPAGTVDAVKRYQSWSKHWSARRKRGDPTLSIVWAAVIDQQAFHSLDTDFRLRHGRSQQTVAMALRDYIARAGWADPKESRAWMDAAESNFPLRIASDGA